ncbi:hypothetical protein ACIODS_04310 [Micromonospora chalcea]|uniref:hypothetical protein n=1 Tax=Micromonospora chalcea TaxID=1874 RepID=UPI00382D78A1
MTQWRPRSIREGIRSYDGPYEGIPDHLQASLEAWLRNQFGWSGPSLNTDYMLRLASSIQISVAYSFDGRSISAQIFAHLNNSQELYLDALDAALHLAYGSGADPLREILHIGGSVWTVSEDGTSLVRRIDATATQAFSVSTSHADTATDELKEAWHNAYSRNPNASDAWDHAAKAVEAALIPLVVPTQAKPHLGHVLGQLRGQPARWRLVLPGANEKHSAEPLVAMLDLIWPNPDRHASDSRRVPSLKEAEAVVQLAVTIVQWARNGVLERVLG